MRGTFILSPGSLMRLFFLSQAPAHKCALLFADNSGIDVILGVFPFVRELLCRGTEVSNVSAASYGEMPSEGLSLSRPRFVCRLGGLRGPR